MSDREFREYAVALARGAYMGLAILFFARFSTHSIGWAHVLCGCIATALAAHAAERRRRRQS